MNFPDYFADADSNLNEAEFVIFGVPYDKTSSFRYGASKAPTEIRQASWNFETFDLKTGVDFRDIKVHDYGNIDIKNDTPEVMVKKVREFLEYMKKYYGNFFKRKDLSKKRRIYMAPNYLRFLLFMASDHY